LKAEQFGLLLGILIAAGILGKATASRKHYCPNRGQKPAAMKASSKHFRTGERQIWLMHNGYIPEGPNNVTDTGKKTDNPTSVWVMPLDVEVLPEIGQNRNFNPKENCRN
jgi:hypothetical protein